MKSRLRTCSLLIALALGCAGAAVSQTQLPIQSFFAEHQVLSAAGNWLVTGGSSEIAIYHWNEATDSWQSVFRDLLVEPVLAATDGALVAVLTTNFEIRFYRLGNGKVILQHQPIALGFVDVVAMAVDGLLAVAVEEDLDREVRIYDEPSGSASPPPLLEVIHPPLANDCVGDFGDSLAIQNSVVVIGAACQGLTGEAHVYGRTSGTDDWFWFQELLALDLEAGNQHGAAVAIDGDWIAVGAPGDDVFDKFELIANAGAVRLYEAGFIGVFEQKDALIRDSFEADDRFGSSLDLSGSLLVAAAPLDDAPGLMFDFADVGSVEIHRRNVGDEWPRIGRLSPGNPVENIGAELGEVVVLSAAGPIAAAPGNFRSYAFALPAVIFEDGFESGNAAGWSAAVP